jgi:hypothetical protein
LSWFIHREESSGSAVIDFEARQLNTNLTVGGRNIYFMYDQQTESVFLLQKESTSRVKRNRETSQMQIRKPMT